MMAIIFHECMFFDDMGIVVYTGSNKKKKRFIKLM